MALIYIVEDDDSIREIESIALKNSNYIVRSFCCAADFFKKTGEILPDLVLLDIMLPDESGYDILVKLRKNPKTAKIPVIMVTAKTSEMDLIRGLDAGADDYIRKPFSILELLSRIKALLRRTAKETASFFSCGGIELDHTRRIAYADGQAMELTFKEYELLRYLMINEETVLSRDSIMQFVWGTDYEGGTRTVDMHIKTLRKKLGTCGEQIGTVRNVGYVLTSEKKNPQAAVPEKS